MRKLNKYIIHAKLNAEHLLLSVQEKYLLLDDFRHTKRTEKPPTGFRRRHTTNYSGMKVFRYVISYIVTQVSQCFMRVFFFSMLNFADVFVWRYNRNIAFLRLCHLHMNSGFMLLCSKHVCILIMLSFVVFPLSAA